jgi:hypothetical protein
MPAIYGRISIMEPTKDTLVTHLAQDIQHHDLGQAGRDAALKIARDTNISDPTGTFGRLYKDAQALENAGVTRNQLEQLGFPRLKVETRGNQGEVVLTDGKGTTMPVRLSDVEKNIDNKKAEAFAKKIHEHADFGSSSDREALRTAFIQAAKTNQTAALEERINFYLGEMGDSRRVNYAPNHDLDTGEYLKLMSGDNVKDEIDCF